jgi:23S rRNA (guanosine2251-2'-O)-methyltransferase
MKIYGYHPVREALRHRPHEVGRVLVVRGRAGGRRKEVEALCRRNGVALAEVGEAEIDRLTGQGAAVHNGFAAELRPAAGAGEPAAGAARDDDLVVLVEDVQDPRNLGALMRVCEGAGVGRLLIRDRGSAPVSPVAVKASAGASEYLPSERITNSAQAIEVLKRDGFWVYGVAPGGEPAWDVDLTGKVAFALGGEEKGLRHRTESLCDKLVGLPMRGRVESLNLATAAAAVLYEAVRQRTGKG